MMGLKKRIKKILTRLMLVCLGISMVGCSSSSSDNSDSPSIATSLEINPSSLFIYIINKPVTLNVNRIPAGSIGAIEWSVANPTIVEVNQNGRVVAKREGSTTVNVSLISDPLINDMCTVTVGTEPTGISLTHSGFVLNTYNQTYNSGVVLTPVNSSGNIIWESSNPAIFSVNQNGQITALKTGTSNLTASVEGTSLIASILGTVSIPVVSINVQEDVVRLSSIGQNKDIVASLNPGAIGDFIFSSTSENIFTVNTSGNISAVNFGQATLNISVSGETVSKSVPVIISIPVTGITLSHSQINLTTHLETQNVTGSINEGAIGGIEWESSNTSVCTVSSSGQITAIKSGMTTVIARVIGTDVTEEVNVNVNIPITSLTVNPEAITLNSYEESTSVNITLNSGATGNITYQTTNVNVFNVSSEGLVEAVASGTTTLNVIAN